MNLVHVFTYTKLHGHVAACFKIIGQHLNTIVLKY